MFQSAVRRKEQMTNRLFVAGQCATPRPPAQLGVMSVDRYCGITFK